MKVCKGEMVAGPIYSGMTNVNYPTLADCEIILAFLVVVRRERKNSSCRRKCIEASYKILTENGIKVTSMSKA